MDQLEQPVDQIRALEDRLKALEGQLLGLVSGIREAGIVLIRFSEEYQSLPLDRSALARQRKKVR